MKVLELIQKLSGLDKNVEVLLDNDNDLNYCIRNLTDINICNPDEVRYNKISKDLVYRKGRSSLKHFIPCVILSAGYDI